jgi:hypothetical protein
LKRAGIDHESDENSFVLPIQQLLQSDDNDDYLKLKK